MGFGLFIVTVVVPLGNLESVSYSGNTGLPTGRRILRKQPGYNVTSSSSAAIAKTAETAETTETAEVNLLCPSRFPLIAL
jgi:hypothetical protein